MNESSGVISVGDGAYPLNLDMIPDKPSQLHYRGALSLLRQRLLVSIVGTRKYSSYGKTQVERLMRFLSGYEGITTVSGLAVGIDSFVHEYSMQNSIPTIAVLPMGINNITPRSNYNLAKRIIGTGGLHLSEFEGQPNYGKGAFPRRNRIIAGLGLLTIVIEAPHKSGAINTAYLAHSYERAIFTLPGDLGSPASQGVYRLIDEQIAQCLTPSYRLLREFLEANDIKPKIGAHVSGANANRERDWNHGGEAISREQQQLLEFIAAEKPTYQQILDATRKRIIAGQASLVDNNLAKLQLAGMVSKDNLGRYCHL